MTHWSRRVFLGGLGLAAGRFWSGHSVAIGGRTKNRPFHSKSELVGRLSGVHNFLTTPFRSNYELDVSGMGRNVAHHARQAPENMTIVVSGGLGELFTLGVDEHSRLVQAAVEGAQGRLPVVAGVGGGYRNTLEMAKNAESAGADAILIFASPFACTNAEGAYQLLSKVANSVRIGALLYPCGEGDFWPDVVRRLAELPNVMGMKDASGDVQRGQALDSVVGDEFLWIAEGEGHAEKALPVGAQAYTTAVSVFVPDACLDFWREGTAGNIETMKSIHQERIAPVVKLRSVRPGYGISGIKVGLEALERAGGPVRPPGTPVAPDDRMEITAIARKYSESSGTD